jgi:hypothetical protein
VPVSDTVVHDTTPHHHRVMISNRIRSFSEASSPYPSSKKAVGLCLLTDCVSDQSSEGSVENNSHDQHVEKQARFGNTQQLGCKSCPELSMIWDEDHLLAKYHGVRVQSDCLPTELIKRTTGGG